MRFHSSYLASFVAIVTPLTLWIKKLLTIFLLLVNVRF
jgi:hypothetical protein